jgi:preprotein translocase subunit SecD
MDKNNIILSFAIILFFISIFFAFDNTILKFKYGLDLEGGVILTYNADLNNIKKEDYNDILAATKDLIERRINTLGISETNISYYRSGKIIVEIPSIKNPEEAISVIGKTPFLEFRTTQSIGTETIFIPTELTGKYLKTANVVFETQTGLPVVSLELTNEGAKIFEKLTRENLGKPIGIFIDNNLISAPVVREVISGGKAIIEGNFSLQQAKELAANLKQGALPVPLKLEGVNQINPTLGSEFKEKMLKSGVIGFLLVIIFMIIYYKKQGLIASLCLIFYVFYNLFIFKLIGVVLTLSSVTGFILSVGMAVDANILIAERIKEERKKLQDIQKAITNGFNRAWTSIRDSNITTIISSIIIYFITTSFVRGFALTLFIGVLISLLTAFYLTKILTNRIIKT